MLREKICFIGAGNMAEAIIGGILESGLIKKDNISACDIKKERLNFLKNKFGIIIEENNQNAVKNADIIVLSVKPQNVKEVLSGIKGSFQQKEILPLPLHFVQGQSQDDGSKNTLTRQFVISIAAGITTGTIESEIGEIPVIRVMPNTPALVKKGMSAISKGKFANSKEEEIASNIFQSVGKVIKIEERFLDIVTALSGSGPGYIFYIMEAMIEAGVRYGLARDIAKTLVFQAFSGSAELALTTGKEPEELRKAVCSPGGTTLAILKVLEEKSVSEAFISAVEAGYNRSKELSEGSGCFDRSS